MVLPLACSAYKGEIKRGLGRPETACFYFQPSGEAPMFDRIVNPTRRQFLTRGSTGLGALALNYLLRQESPSALLADAAKPSLNPLSPKPGHHPASAKSVIWLFMEGGPSHLDLFDPKPTLEKLAGQPMPASFGRPITAMGTGANALMPSQRTFKQYGQSGIWVSDWYSQIAAHVDDIAVIRSCWADGLNHVGSVCQMNTGSILAGRPSLGAWTTYGLGSANDNLPTFVVLTDAAEVLGGPKNWSSGFLPATYQGTQFRNDGTPIFHLAPPETISEQQQRSKLDFLTALNRRFSADKLEDSDLEARTQSYELAYRMQSCRARSRGAFQRKRTDAPTLWPRRPGNEPFRRQLPAGSPPGGAGCSFHRSLLRQWQWLGCAHGSGRQSFQDVPDFRSADRRAADGFEGSRAAGHDSGGLGRRVWPHAVQ